MLSRRTGRASSGTHVGGGDSDGGPAITVDVNLPSEKDVEERAHLLSAIDSEDVSKIGFGNLRGAPARTLQHRLQASLRWLALAITGLLLLNVIYLSFAWLFFVDPCVVARDTHDRLQQEVRVGITDARKPHGIPKIIHQQWKNDIVPAGDFTKYHNMWKTLYPEPEYTHMLWTDESARELIKNEFSWFLEAYDNFYMNIQRADAARYFVLYKYGGLYADLDYEPFTNFWEHIPEDRVSLIESPYKINEEVQNSLMAGPKGDPFWNITFKIMYERRKSHKVLSSTGPSMVDEAMRRSPHPTWFHVLPCENFHRIPLGEAGKNAPGISRLARAVMAYSPLVKTCGNWQRKDDCHFGLHHNAVSYMSNMGEGMFEFLLNF